jgi:hypothetical protein
MRLLFTHRKSANLLTRYSLLITLIFILSSFVESDYPKDITGTWEVVSVYLLKPKLPLADAQKKTTWNSTMLMFQNISFNFDANHHFHFSPKIKGIPKPGTWNYYSTYGIIKITESDGKRVLMNFKIVEKHDTTYFKLDESPLVLGVVHKSN